jgi:predicted branched-subunit amino acid permease
MGTRSADKPAKKPGNVKAISLGVGFATGLYGISFGALSVAAGLDIWQTMALSLLMFSGGSQFAFIGVLATGSSVGPAVLSAWLLGVRNGFYAVRMAPIISVDKLIRPLAAQLTIDESNAVSLSQEPNRAKEKLGFWLTGIAVFIFWNVFTFLGALVGSQLGSPTDWGLDAAAAAAFLGLIWPRLSSSRLFTLAIISAFIATMLSGVLPPGMPVLLTALVAVGFWLVGIWRNQE